MRACKKIQAGLYEYKDWVISFFGYYHPEKKTCWEGVNKITGATIRGFTKKEIVFLINQTEKYESNIYTIV